MLCLFFSCEVHKSLSLLFRNSCGLCEEPKVLWSLRRQFRSYLVLVASGAMLLGRDQLFLFVNSASAFYDCIISGWRFGCRCSNWIISVCGLTSLQSFHRLLSPLSAVPLISLAGFGLYELGFPGVSISVELIWCGCRLFFFHVPSSLYHRNTDSRIHLGSGCQVCGSWAPRNHSNAHIFSGLCHSFCLSIHLKPLYQKPFTNAFALRMCSIYLMLFMWQSLCLTGFL